MGPLGWPQARVERLKCYCQRYAARSYFGSSAANASLDPKAFLRWMVTPRVSGSGALRPQT